ncbi:MAG: 4-hydroxybutyrate dehydrogenase [Ruminococcaceae bacterium]|nr:4-hydroxybutyrate dehydrogenase [Oscillospiraceae bacterium]
MNQLILRPSIHHFSDCQEFVSEFRLSAADMVLTNEYIYTPHFGKLNLPVRTIFQEKYGSGEPTDTMIEAIIRDAELDKCSRIIAIGGGTVIDIAKILAVADTDNLDSLYEKGLNLHRYRELVIVPTTCGTGSEVTNIAVVNRTRLGVKMGLVSEDMYATDAVLIPELLTGLPYSVFATSSIDALIHAVESSLSPKATPYSKLFGYKAIEMILNGYQKIVANGPDARLNLLDDFLIASNFAGLAFSQAGCAAVHALSYPLGGTYHVAHGESNYAVFTGVMKNYMEIKNDGEIENMNRFLAEILHCTMDSVYNELEKLMNQILPKKALHEYGVTPEDLISFTHNVMETQGRLMANNFVKLDKERVYKIYRELY